MAYNYYKEMKDDILNVLSDHSLYNVDKLAEYIEDDDKDGLANELNDLLWAEDSVTGNGSGSYFFNSQKAAEAVMSNVNLLKDAVLDFDTPVEELAEHITDYEWQDVTIRCYLLGQVIDDLIGNDWDKLVKIINGSHNSTNENYRRPINRHQYRR